MRAYYDAHGHLCTRLLEDVEPVQPVKSVEGYACYELQAGQAIPLHDHPTAHRWVVMRGVVDVTIGDDLTRLYEAASVEIPRWVPHRAVAVSDTVILCSVWSIDGSLPLNGSATPHDGAVSGCSTGSARHAGTMSDRPHTAAS